MITVQARCTCGPHQPFRPIEIERRDLRPHDVLIDIAFAGICHSDLDHAYRTRGTPTIYPLVPGHEIAGIVSAVGPAVTRFAVGDRVAVGTLVDSCRVCDACRAGLENYCTGERGRILAYNSIGYDGAINHGGYSEKTVVDEAYVVRVPDAMSLASAAPMLCAGITMYSPLRHWRVGPGIRLAIIGLGGLGHIGIQIAHALGAHVTVFDLSPAKREDAERLGADAFHVVTETAAFAAMADAFDIIISTVPATIDIDAYLTMLALDGVLVNLAVPHQPLSVSPALLLANRRSIAGTRSGGMAETQEMLDFCAARGIAAEVEIVAADQIDAAFARLEAGDVRYRFVIDNATLRTGQPTLSHAEG